MGPYLKSLLAEPSTKDLASAKPDLLASLESKNKAELESIEAKLADAETNLGETEISDALKAKAAYLARIGDKVSDTCSRNRVTRGRQDQWLTCGI